MSDVTTRRKRRVARLAALAGVGVPVVGDARVGGVLPGSCSFAATTRVPSESSSTFLTRAGRIVPETLITKYRDTRSGAFHVRVRHTSGRARRGARWRRSSSSRFHRVQAKNASASLSWRRAHRVAGRALVATSATMTFGYVFAIHKKVCTSTSTTSVPGKRRGVLRRAAARQPLWRVAGGAGAFETFEHACACWFFATAAFAAFVAARGNRTGDREGGCAGTARGQSGTSPRGTRSPRRGASSRFPRLVPLFFRRTRVRVAGGAEGHLRRRAGARHGVVRRRGEAAIRDADALDEPEGKEE